MSKGYKVDNYNQRIIDLEDNEILHIKVSLTAAQILLLNTTPVDLLPAPGAGLIYNVVNILGTLTFNSVAYATNTTLQIFNNSGSINIIMNNTVLLTSTVTRTNQFARVVPTGTAPMQYVSNEALKMNVAGGNPTLGNSTMNIYVLYQLLRL